MKKKIPLLFLTLFGIVFAGSAKQAIADAPSLMKQADRLNDSHFYYQAEQLYRTIAENHPNTDYALSAQRKLVCVLIGAEKPFEQVDAEFNKLITGFAGNIQLPTQIHKIGSNCRYFGKYQKAKYYYNYVIENFPDKPQAILSQKDLVKAAIEVEDYTEEQQELDKLKTRFANHPDLAKALCSVADCYTKEKKYVKANELNKYIVSNFPQSEAALRAQKNLVKSYIAYNDDPNTETSMEKLSADFANRPGQSSAIRSIADGYRDKGRYDKAIELYRYLLETYPNDPNKIHCQKGLAIANIWRNKDVNDPNTTAAVSTLVADFNDHPGFVYAMFRIGEEFYKKAHKLSKASLNETAEGYFSKAIETWQRVSQSPPKEGLTDWTLYLTAESYMYIDDYNNATGYYKKVVNDWPNSKYKMRAQKYLAIANIGIGDDPNALAQVERLIADFNDDPFLPRIVFHIGEEYFYNARRYENRNQTDESRYCYNKALDIWRIIIQELPIHNNYTPNAYYFSADCYRQLKEYKNAITYYGEVSTNWPDYRLAWGALFKTGRLYEKMKKLKFISKLQAYPEIKAAYEQLLERYPDCDAAGYARYWLDNYWEKFLVWEQMMKQKKQN